MGENVIYICKNCGHKFSLMLGIGMLDSSENLLNLNGNLNILTRCKNDNMKNFDELKDFFKKKDINLINNYAEKPFICEKCNAITSKFDFTLKCKSDNTTFSPQYICSDCKGELKLINDDKFKNLICPKCHKGELAEEVFMSWD